jgi:hypothetical protein
MRPWGPLLYQVAYKAKEFLKRRACGEFRINPPEARVNSAQGVVRWCGSLTKVPRGMFLRLIDAQWGFRPKSPKLGHYPLRRIPAHPYNGGFAFG